MSLDIRLFVSLAHKLRNKSVFGFIALNVSADNLAFGFGHDALGNAVSGVIEPIEIIVVVAVDIINIVA